MRAAWYYNSYTPCNYRPRLLAGWPHVCSVGAVSNSSTYPDSLQCKTFVKKNRVVGGIQVDVLSTVWHTYIKNVRSSIFSDRSYMRSPKEVLWHVSREHLRFLRRTGKVAKRHGRTHINSQYLVNSTDT